IKLSGLSMKFHQKIEKFRFFGLDLAAPFGLFAQQSRKNSPFVRIFKLVKDLFPGFFPLFSSFLL
ncbi:hypothetical protein R0J87_25240, partial [Halomonas sp. SIMBA_159]